MSELEFKPTGNKAALMKAAQPPMGITLDEYRGVVLAAVGVWNAHKIMPTAQNIIQFGLTSHNFKTVKRVLNSEEFTLEMGGRGIPWGDHSSLSAEQLQCIEAVTNPARRGTLEYRLKSVGVTPTQFRAWKNNPKFKAQISAMSKDVLNEYAYEMDTVLVNAALDGKLDAIRYVNELSGRHDPNKRQAVDVKRFVQSVIEIVQTYVTDPEALMAVGNALLELTQQNEPSQQGMIAQYKGDVING